MKHLLILKLIFRNWWRNKFFTFISILSLAIGISCVNLLITYVIHENSIESDNPKKDNILYLMQDSPFTEGSRISFITINIPSLMQAKYPEIESNLQIQDMSVSYAKIDENIIEDVFLIGADSTFSDLFPYKVTSGNLDNVLSKPGMVGLKQNIARKIFGNEDPIGKYITFNHQEYGIITYEVGAVLKDYPQAFLKFDFITSNREESYGGISMLLIKEGTDRDILLEKINKDKEISRMKVDDGNYYFYSIQEVVFTSFPDTLMSIVHFAYKELILIGIFAAFLIMLIACFNYMNILLSRTLKQIRLIHVEKLMGATYADIRYQLFADAFLTVIIAFILSILLMHDFLPIFNFIMHSNLETSFFFNSKVLWILILFVAILSIIPVSYISNHLSKLSISNYKRSYTGKSKHNLISIMVVIQFIFSIGLLLSNLVVNAQLEFTKQTGHRFNNIFEFGGYNMELTQAFKQEVEKLPSVLSTTESFGPAMAGDILEMPIPQSDGSIMHHPVQIHTTGKNLLDTYSIKLKEHNAEGLTLHGRTILINETFLNDLIPHETDPIGEKWNKYNQYADSIITIGGIIEDFAIMPANMKIRPAAITIYFDPHSFYHLSVKMDGVNNQKTITEIKNIWERFQFGVFQYKDVYQTYLDNNQKIINLSNLLKLYSTISLSLTFLGLLGIVLYSVKQKTREIGIRKVNGANIWQILLLLVKPYFVQVLLAYLIAMPVTLYLLIKWLEQFVYRIDITLSNLIIPFVAVLFVTFTIIVLGGWKIANTNPVEILKRNE